jgi:ABC-2 type transport system permease protein
VTFDRVFVVARKELRQLRRDRLTLAMMVVIPLLQLMLFGFAIDIDVRHTPTVVVDSDQHRDSRELVQRLEATGFYDITGATSDYASVERAFRTRKAKVAIVIPAGFSADLAANRPTHVQLLVDGSDAQTIASATEAAQGVIASWQRGEAPITLDTSILYNPDVRAAVNIVPGLVGVILTMTLVMFTGMAIVRERERGTLEQLIVTPVRSIELVLGKILPYIAIGFVQMTIILVAGAILFHVPFVGSIPTLYVLATLFIAANLSLGLFFSTLAKTQQQAMQMSFFFFLPQLLLSGFMFPFEAMPRAAQVLGQVFPLTHFLRVIRGIVLKGASIVELRGEIAALALIAAVLMTASALRFRKRLG